MTLASSAQRKREDFSVLERKEELVLKRSQIGKQRKFKL